jgi:hypothetical protein
MAIKKSFSALGHDISIQPSQDITLQGLPVDKKRVKEAYDTFKKYRSGLAVTHQRVRDNEEWYKQRQWELIRRQAAEKKDEKRPEPASAWLLNAILNKHADAEDNFPEPNVLPRMKDDEETAKIISSVLPVVLERNEFDKTYSDAWWDKLKSGTGVYVTVWDPTLENGLGDISIKRLSLLNLFWDPSVTDIQQSPNLFVTKAYDIEHLEAMYPEYKGKLSGGLGDVTEYYHDENIDTSKKSVVIDWYYKVYRDGEPILHFAKFVGETLLFSSENEAAQGNTGYTKGWYHHGRYPVHTDVLYPIADMAIGFGVIDIGKDCQLYIDKMGQAILENALFGARPRILAKESAGINLDDYCDASKPVVLYDGQPEAIKPLEHPKLDSLYFSVYQQKIDELKETTGNRDFNAGSTSGGVTAAAAIAALQESGNKLSRDAIAGSYRVYKNICLDCIELMRQFYSETRYYRIMGPDGYSFVEFSNANIQPQMIQQTAAEPYFRLPVFDVKVKPSRKNPFSRNVQNQMAQDLYGIGFFNPQLADQALIALELMDFEGKDKVRERIQANQTMFAMIQQLQGQVQMLAQALTGKQMAAQNQGQAPAPAKSKSTGDRLASASSRAQTQYGPSYGERIAARAVQPQ